MIPTISKIKEMFFPKPKTDSPPPPPPPPAPGSSSPTRSTAGGTLPPPPPGVPSNPADLPNVNGRSGGNYDREIVLDLIDALQKPPPQTTQDYMTILNRVASFLGANQSEGPAIILAPTGAKSMWDQISFPEQNATGFSVKNVLKPLVSGPVIDSQEKLRNVANKTRNDIYDVVNRINSFQARAINAGFVPPLNPFAAAQGYNSDRVGFSPVNLPNDRATQIAESIRSYLKLLGAERTGKLNLDKNVMKAAQLSSATLSLSGFGGTGDTSLDLLKLLPDADEVKAQKSLEALSVFDFTKRIPKVLFTAFYAPGGVPKGIIVGWKKVADASGYVIRRRNIFDGRQVQYTVTNDEIRKSTERLSEYVRAWILSFYDNVQNELVFSFLDTDVTPHGYFTYKIQAYQLQNENPGGMFAVDTSPFFISAPLKIQIRAALEQLDPNVVGGTGVVATADTISPYPVLSHFLLGDAKYDWLLAAINIRKSINRGDTRTTTRGYSYLAAQLDFLFSQADAGNFVIPTNRDLNQVLKNVNDSISKFGVNQVLREALQETGALYHFEGKDPSDNALFRSVDTGKATDSGLISIVASAIDPETATMNLSSLAQNLPLLLNGEYVGVAGTLQAGVKSSKIPAPGEIAVPRELGSSGVNDRSEDEVQYLSKLGDVRSDVIDMTTVDGISVFLRTVRIFSDIGPNRGAPIVERPQTLIPDPVKILLPPPPPPSPVQPVPEPFIEAGETSDDRARREAAAKAEADRKKYLEQQVNIQASLKNGVKIKPPGK